MRNRVTSEEIEKLLKNYDFSVVRRRYIPTLDFDIYRITAKDLPQQRALRIYANEQTHLESIRSEIAWLSALAKQGIQVPKPLPDKDGKYIHTVTDEAGIARYGVMLTWLPGRFFDRGLTPQRLYRVGLLVGNLHKVSEQLARSGSLQTKRVAFDMDFHSWTTGQRMASPYLSEDLGRIVQITAQQIQKRLLTLATDANDYGFVHADLHQWNYLFSGREAGAIDFGDCGWGHYSLDLATVLQYLKYPLVGNWDHRVQYPRLKEALLSGYQEVRALPSTIEDQIETYIISRMIFTLEWMLDDWPHPDYLSWGPQFLRESMDMFADYLNQ